MSLSVKQTRRLYKIALSIGSSTDLNDMLEQALQAFVFELDCVSGAIFSTLPDNDYPIDEPPVCAIPASFDADSLRQVRLADSATGEIRQQLPNGNIVHRFSVPDFGAMVLLTEDTPIPAAITDELPPLMKKLSQAIIARQSCAEQEQWFDAVPFEGVVVMQQGVILSANQRFAEMLGYDEPEVIGKHAADFVAPESRDMVLHNIATNDPHPYECLVRRKDGWVFPVEVHGKAVLFQGRDARMASMRDMSARYHLEQMRNDFLTTVSHELRTPLASIMGFIKTILDGRPGPLTDVQRRFLQNSYQSSERLLKLVEALLAVTDAQNGKMELDSQPFWPDQIVQNTCDTVELLGTAKSIALELKNEWLAAEPVVGDQERLEQVMTHLIGNAVKFSSEGQTVVIRSTSSDDGWLFEVTDSGIGIPEADVPHLFQRFYRASNARAQQIQGAGLGLWLCKTIVERHAGQIGLESVLNSGTKIWFTIPLQN